MPTAKEAFEQMRKREADDARFGSVATQLPRYKCHKEVWALKIKEIYFDVDAAQEDGNRETDGSAIIVPEEAGFASFRVSPEYVSKHKPQAGGYYIVYEDGYKSWSPADVFESGYSKI